MSFQGTEFMNLQGTSFFVGPNSVRDGLVVYFDPINPESYPDAGTILYDISIDGVTRNATIANTVIVDDEGLVFNELLPNYFTISQPNITFSPNRFTIEMWIKPTASGYLCTPASVGFDQWILVNGNQSVTFQTHRVADFGNDQIASLAGSVPFNKWSCINCTLDYLDKRLYINGKLIQAKTLVEGVTNPANWSSTWWFGIRSSTFQNPFNGTMSIIKIYNRALTGNEVQQNFYAHKGRYDNIIDAD